METEVDIDLESELTQSRILHAVRLCKEHRLMAPGPGEMVITLCEQVIRIVPTNSTVKCATCKEKWGLPFLPCGICGKMTGEEEW